jgi:4-diphosphocytidyl-2-C-methyl-D-erythritol kinase
VTNARRSVVAPAKLNLGLEILGRRDDGFHEVRTILCTLSLHDTLTFSPSPTGRDDVTFEGMALDLPARDNLIVRALEALRSRGARIGAQRVVVDKRIPAAAGLGGASSDAAATIRAFAAELAATGGNPAELAASLGSDVPFFLDGPVALASGRGEVLSPLPSPTGDVWAVLVTPHLDIPAKTSAMYAAIDPAWWSSGAEVERIAAQLPRPPEAAPPNTFERAILTLYPRLAAVREHLLAEGAPFVALTGAGPTFYSLVGSEVTADRLAAAMDRSNGHVTAARLGTVARHEPDQGSD